MIRKPQKKTFKLNQIPSDFHCLDRCIVVVRKGGLNKIFDSQAENFLSRKGQSTKSISSEFC